MITAFPPPSRPASARSGEARSPNYRGRPGAAFCNSTPLATARNPCPRTLLASVTPATRCVRCPAVGHPGRTQPPCGRDRSRVGNPVVPGHPSPAAAVLAPACRARQYPAHTATVPAEPPADLPLRAPTAVGTATREHLATVPRIPGLSGASAPATHPPYECRLPAGFTKRDGIGIGDSGRTPGS
jgi:hypothetical protein